MKTNAVRDIREYFIQALENEEFVIDKTGVKTIELVNASFIADEDAIFGEVNWDYVEREIRWYEMQSLNVNDIPGDTPKIWKDVADWSGIINSNYGWCIWNYQNGEQYINVLKELKANPNSRRGVMIYNRPSMWKDYNFNNRSDFMCTNAVQYLIRNNKLEVVVQMRSNDALFGYKNDRAWQAHVQTLLAANLDIELGNIHWNAGSLHVYERHFNLIKE